MSNKTKLEHESYGLLSFSRSTSSGGKPLFGSSILHSETIRMRLHKAHCDRDLNSDFFMPDDEIVEVEMSQAQFAELITSMNMGSGVPVTIRWLKGEGRKEDCPFIDKRQMFEKELSDNMDNCNKNINELIGKSAELLKKKGALTAAEKQEMTGLLYEIQREIGRNTKFIYTMFNEQMDKTTKEAKGEIEAFVQTKMNQIAAIAIAANNESILSNNKITIEIPEKKKENNDD